MPRENLKISDEIIKRIDTYCQNTYDDGHRNHLGASLIGDKCKAKLWFTFRWVYHHKHSGRMQRLFNSGHVEEARIIEWLRGAGFEVIDGQRKVNNVWVENTSYFQGANKDNFKQIKISDCNGHFGGSFDGVINMSEFYLDNCLLECKTNKTGSEFKGFFEDGMELIKPKHWAQTCTYGYKKGLKNCVYICENKDNSDLFIQVVKLDWEEGKRNIEKASEIINSQTRPNRIAETAAYFECKMCDYANVCHKGLQAEKNCRSCKYATPVENAEWKCNLYNNLIPKDFISKGCDSWISII